MVTLVASGVVSIVRLFSTQIIYNIQSLYLLQSLFDLSTKVIIIHTIQTNSCSDHANVDTITS